MAVGGRAIIDASFSFEAKKYALRQAKDGVIVSFVVHPSDVVDKLLSAPIGEHYVVALAPYEKAAEQAEQQPEAPAPEPEKVLHISAKLSNDAFWMCRRRDFQQWLGVHSEVAADHQIKSLLGIRSKTELDTDDGAAIHWRDLIDRFHASTMPQERA